ncbi:hypothetical protein ABEO66_06790 [Bacillus pacificus]|uniref:hypothetical protein n=1 Tax=Bacillus pacificus TaxID=2026187 RepID=UPI003D24F73A
MDFTSKDFINDSTFSIQRYGNVDYVYIPYFCRFNRYTDNSKAETLYRLDRYDESDKAVRYFYRASITYIRPSTIESEHNKFSFWVANSLLIEEEHGIIVPLWLLVKNVQQRYIPYNLLGDEMMILEYTPNLNDW